MNVVKFEGGKVAADARLIEVIEEILRDAKAGKIDWFAGITGHRQTHYGNRVCHNAYHLAALGGIYMLLSWVREKWEDLPGLDDYPEPPAG